MKRRRNLFLLLLSFSLIPLLVMGMICQVRTHRLEDFLPSELTRRLKRTAADELAGVAESIRRDFQSRQKETLEHLKWAVSCLTTGPMPPRGIQGILDRLKGEMGRPYDLEVLPLSGIEASDSCNQRMEIAPSEIWPRWVLETGCLTNTTGQTFRVRLELDFLDLMPVPSLASDQSSGIEAYLVRYSPGAEPGRSAPQVLARRSHPESQTESHPVWETPAPGQEPRNQEPEDQTLLIEALKQNAQTSETSIVSQEPSSAVWAKTTLFGDLQLVLVRPHPALGRETMVAARVVREFSGQGCRLFWIAAVVVLILAAAAAFHFSKSTTATLRLLIQAWTRLGEGDFSIRLPEKTGDERDKLIHTFNEVVPKLEEHFRTTLAMDLAQKVQLNLLPARAPQIRGLDVAGASIFCDQTSGDYFDYLRFENQPDRLGIAVGDVSGHGLPAALLMTTARAQLRTLSHRSGGLSDRLSRMNRLIIRDIGESGHFMTLFLAEIDMEKKNLTWARAGHDPALAFYPDGKGWVELKSRGPALGLSEGVTFEEKEMPFHEDGLVLVVGTDGIWEAHREDGELFGKKRFQRVVEQNAHLKAQEILTAVLEAVYFWQGKLEPDDDLTLVVVKIRKPA